MKNTKLLRQNSCLILEDSLVGELLFGGFQFSRHLLGKQLGQARVVGTVQTVPTIP